MALQDLKLFTCLFDASKFASSLLLLIKKNLDYFQK